MKQTFNTDEKALYSNLTIYYMGRRSPRLYNPRDGDATSGHYLTGMHPQLTVVGDVFKMITVISDKENK